VEIEDNLTFSEELTPALDAAYAELANEIFVEIDTLLGITPLTNGRHRCARADAPIGRKQPSSAG
jgi:hypothetical protein